MALLPRMQAGAEWTGPLLLDDEVAAALSAAYPDPAAEAEVREAYMRTGEWPQAVALPPTAQRFTLRTLSAAEARDAQEAAGMEPQAWSWYQAEIRREVEASVDATFPRQPCEPAEGVYPYPVPAPGEAPDSEGHLVAVATWELERLALIGRLSDRAIRLAPQEVQEALRAWLCWRTRTAVERVCRALVAAEPRWEVQAEGPGGGVVEVSWRAGIESFGIDADGGGLGARLALELDAHLARMGRLATLGKALSGPPRS